MDIHIFKGQWMQTDGQIIYVCIAQIALVARLRQEANQQGRWIYIFQRSMNTDVCRWIDGWKERDIKRDIFKLSLQTGRQKDTQIDKYVDRKIHQNTNPSVAINDVDRQIDGWMERKRLLKHQTLQAIIP